MFNIKNLFICSILLVLESIDEAYTIPIFGYDVPHQSAQPGGGLGTYGGFHGGLHQDASAYPLINNDHHRGVSIIGAGASAHKGITFDLTKEADAGHAGLFGGSFLSGGSHGKTGRYKQGSADHAGIDSYSAGALSSYDVGSHGGQALASYSHESGETSPVLYSSYKENEHNFGLSSAAIHSAAGGGAGFDSHAITAPQQFGGGIHFDHSSGFGL